jgi:light-regulated signal transduction histidine kinase (bacteriophytochrome)
MTDSTLSDALTRCDSEPIQAPGSVQPHGALVCFDANGRVLAQSSTAVTWLGALPGIGHTPTPLHLDEACRDAIDAALKDPNHSGDSTEWESVDGMRFDLVMHWSEGSLMSNGSILPISLPCGRTTPCLPAARSGACRSAATVRWTNFCSPAPMRFER